MSNQKINQDMQEYKIREQLVIFAKSMFERGLSSGSSGNISVKLDDDFFIATPTNSSLGFLSSERLSKVDITGKTVSGDQASKEILMHLAYYKQRPDIGAVVHLHSPYLTAYSCLANLDPTNAMPALTPYFVMRIGQLPLVPYLRPGSPLIAEAVSKLAQDHQAILLANHGPLIVGKDLQDAIYNAEELEETAKLFFLLKNHEHMQLNAEQIQELKTVFPK